MDTVDGGSNRGGVSSTSRGLRAGEKRTRREASDADVGDAADGVCDDNKVDDRLRTHAAAMRDKKAAKKEEQTIMGKKKAARIAEKARKEEEKAARRAAREADRAAKHAAELSDRADRVANKKFSTAFFSHFEDLLLAAKEHDDLPLGAGTQPGWKKMAKALNRLLKREKGAANYVTSLDVYSKFTDAANKVELTGGEDTAVQEERFMSLCRECSEIIEERMGAQDACGAPAVSKSTGFAGVMLPQADRPSGNIAGVADVPGRASEGVDSEDDAAPAAPVAPAAPAKLKADAPRGPPNLVKGAPDQSNTANRKHVIDRISDALGSLKNDQGDAELRASEKALVDLNTKKAALEVSSASFERAMNYVNQARTAATQAITAALLRAAARAVTDECDEVKQDIAAMIAEVERQ